MDLQLGNAENIADHLEGRVIRHDGRIEITGKGNVNRIFGKAGNRHCKQCQSEEQCQCFFHFVCLLNQVIYRVRFILSRTIRNVKFNSLGNKRQFSFNL